MTSLADLRINYSRASLDEHDVASDPFRQFDKWLNEALDAKLPEPNTMTLATADAAGRPSARIMLIKGVDQRGFVFFTNYESRKGHEIEANPHAALLFYWIELERQVRIEGCLEKIAAEESDAYYASRPVGSRLGAWASAQSTVIADRAVLETREREARERYGDNPPRPPHWGGFRVVPASIEFWQGRPSRLHDRLRYTRDAGAPDRWVVERLSP
ncbi:pyridoxamine 5'-phosphate oxidase [Burkholderia perseverans]|uniref:pyridoxamine 5'-phosphate oxidase n=1 Tax=Burkholderia perseverans TaxID=2615214 RepID=UPI001FEF655C|nr:pyridoxamine 5'-phosphate oxidase [Burkholderia perseverans]